jgi:lysozyme
MTKINPLVVDLSHHNWDRGPPLDFATAKASGLAAVIVKATEGATYQDPKCRSTLALVKEAGLLRGAYHFGTAADVDQQVANFLATIGDPGDLLLVLDFENNEPNLANTMSKDQAIDFLKKLEAKTGRKPVLYTGSRMYDLFGKTPAPAFSPYRVWWARYAETVDLHPTWKSYWLWQYTDGFHGQKPHQVAGLGFCDINTYAGTAQELRAGWLI